MALKRFRNVKWDRKKAFKKELQKFDLSSEAFELIDIVSNENIIVVTFNSLLRETGLKYKKFIGEANLMKLYSALAIIDIIDIKKKQSMIKEIKKAIKKIATVKDKKPNNIEVINYEEQLVKRSELTAEEIKEFFSNNDYYTKIAEVFSAPFEDQRYYDFAYLLIWYVSLEITFNKYNVPADINIFTTKIDIQQRMIDILSKISPTSFNIVVININKWFRKYDKKFYKLLNRKLED